AHRTRQVTWQLVEAEAGALAGGAGVVTPTDAWTGESLWSGGAYAALPAGGSVSLPVTLPVADRYLLEPVYHRLPVAPGTVVTDQRLGGATAARLDHGGAGPQGATPWPGYHAIGSLPTAA